MSLFAKLVVGSLLGVVTAFAGCQSEPLLKPGVTDDAIGGVGGAAPGQSKQGGGAGGAETSVPPHYVNVENDARCPDKDSDWVELDGAPCESGSVLLDCSKVWDCQPGDLGYVDEELLCDNGSWSWSSKQGSCDGSSVAVGPDGCPTSEWSLADGLPCAKEGVACANPELMDCGVENAYYTEYIACHDGRWRWDFDEGDCTCDDCGGAGGVGSVGGVGGAGP